MRYETDGEKLRRITKYVIGESDRLKQMKDDLTHYGEGVLSGVNDVLKELERTEKTMEPNGK